MTLEITTALEKELELRFDKYLKRHNLPFKKKQSGGMLYYKIEVDEIIDAYWIGCNMVNLQHRLFDTGITQTL